MSSNPLPEDPADVPPEMLAALGARIRAQRKQLRVSAIGAAEAAGLSRVTLHRIERGEPSVSMGAYLAVLDVLGLRLKVVDRQALPRGAPVSGLPDRIQLAAYPQLQRLAWQTSAATELSPADALALYERNWRHLDPTSLGPAERALVRQLVQEVGGGRLLV